MGEYTVSTSAGGPSTVYEEQPSEGVFTVVPGTDLWLQAHGGLASCEEGAGGAQDLWRNNVQIAFAHQA